MMYHYPHDYCSYEYYIKNSRDINFKYTNIIIPTMAGYVKIASKLQSNPTAVHFGGGGIVLRQTQDSSGRSKVHPVSEGTSA
jgi:hypothetical protein